MNARVTPGTGTAWTTFFIRITARVKLGVEHGAGWEYDLDSFEGNRHPTVGCEGGPGDVIRHGGPGQRLAFREEADWFSDGWCPGRYVGTIRLVRVRTCQPAHPQFVCPVSSRVVGRVTWVVGRGRDRRRTLLLTSGAAGRTVRVRIGQRIDVALPPEYDPPESPGDVLTRTHSAGGYPSGNRSFTEFAAARAGTAWIASSTDYPCLHTTPRCLLAQRIWRVRVVVSG